MSDQEQDQIFRDDWEKLSEKNRDFYVKLTSVYDLQREFKQTQNFYAERIEKIKNDSSPYFNDFTIKSVIDSYVVRHPERLHSNQQHFNQQYDKDRNSLTVNSQPFFAKKTAKSEEEKKTVPIEKWGVKSIPSNEYEDFKLNIDSSSNSAN